ncbi:ATP-binding cassette domain-containing protein [Devosia sp. BK]|uniref:ATP-binding cassette domain-containing protein n=1 Tax=Devosia sp. BK TaxID=2871706 RepID=UPI00293984E8|nr:ATP-binding cassette domain-containing protein [Devosia sp. BK]MDV3253095.1 ATP-binding cassette domain-containing protein [Devosia sp. BK]
MLRADHLAFAYGADTQTYDFSFAAEAGAVTAISGASGSGKSTLFDLLAGFLNPKGGSLDLDGQNLLPLSPETRPISLLLQSDNLFEHLSARENVALGLARNVGKTETRERVDAVLKRMGLESLADQTAATLSGGQKQRIALARTLLRDRPALLLDEPFSALDDDTRHGIRALVGELTKSEGWHTILVSHHEDDITALAQRRYRLENGSLREA